MDTPYQSNIQKNHPGRFWLGITCVFVLLFLFLIMSLVYDSYRDQQRKKQIISEINGLKEINKNLDEDYGSTVFISPTPIVASTQKLTLEKKNPREIKFAQGKIKISFDYNFDVQITKLTENEYVIGNESDGDPTISYYVNKSDFLKKIESYNDSDGNNAGQGYHYGKDTFIKVGEYFFNEYFSYYNPIDANKSGKYDPKISKLLNRYCVYELRDNMGFIDIGGSNLSLRSDICSLYGERTENLLIEVNGKFFSNTDELYKKISLQIRDDLKDTSIQINVIEGDYAKGKKNYMREEYFITKKVNNKWIQIPSGYDLECSLMQKYAVPKSVHQRCI